MNHHLRRARFILLAFLGLAFFGSPGFGQAPVTAFQADFQASAVEAGTAGTNINAGTAIGMWTDQTPTNINVYGDATGTQKALCPDGLGNGYGITANLTNALMLNSNVTVTLLVAIGRYNSPGTNKAFFMTGYDDVGNPSFDLQIFANQNQAAGTNGAVYWNQGGIYTNWFGTNYSNAGDIRQLSVSSSGYIPASLSRLQIQLQATGYVVSLDKNNDGNFEWVSSPLAYNGSPTTISRISITGGSSAGDWFDNILVTGVPGASGVKVVTNGYVTVQPEDQAQIITGWGFDIKGISGYNVTPGYAQELFANDRMNILRVPIWGNTNNPAHPSAGMVIGSYYDDELYAMANARAVNSNVIFFASKKLDGPDSFPDWTKNASGVIASQYALMLADYLDFMWTNGFAIDVLGVDNESTYNEGNITPSVYNSVINSLRSLSVSRGFPLPKHFIAPENYSPDTNWLSTLLNNGWGTNLDIVGTHYYPGSRPLAKLQNLTALGGTRPDWHSEVHWENNFGDVMDNAEAALATLFDCTDTGLSAYVWWAYTESGVKGGIEQAFSVSTTQTRPVTTTDSDGTKATLGKLIARAYRNGTNLVFWVLNNTTNQYSPCAFSINAGTLIGPANYQQWDIAGSVLGSAALASATNFTLPIAPRTVTEINVGYLPSGPDAHYPLEGNVLDSSGHGNNGTPSATATNYVAGRTGLLAMQFNGSNSYVTIPRSIGAATNFSIAFWMKTTSAGGSGTQNQWWNGCGLVDGEVSGTTNDFGVSLLNGSVAFGVGNPDTTLPSSVAVNDGAWHHVAVTRNGFTGELDLYLDGGLNTNRFGPTGPCTAPPNFRLGSLQTGAAGKFYNGTLDDVRLYNGLLDASTIAQLAAAPLPNQPPVFAVINNQTLIAGRTLNVTNIATDPDTPAQVLTWSVQPVIAGLKINTTTGVINWRPTIAQSPTTNNLSVIVADNGTPSLAATQQFTVTVLRPVNPVLSAPQFSAGAFGLTIGGNVGPDYTMQVSSNLTSWTALFTTNPLTLPFTAQLSVSNSLPQQFYRVQLGP